MSDGETTIRINMAVKVAKLEQQVSSPANGFIIFFS